jgi:flagellar FliL protein
VRIFITLLLGCLLSLPVAANEQEAAKNPGGVPTAIYHTLEPALVGNYGNGPKLKYYKADVALRVSSAEAEAKVEHHEPLIRNQLVMLFSQQSEGDLALPEAKEKLRQEALKQVQQVLTEEEGSPLVEDLLFNNLILQG